MLKSFPLLFVIIALLAILAGSAVAAPLSDETYYGLDPLYDSGWVQTEEGLQTFEHDLNAWPLVWVLLVADDEDGLYIASSPDPYYTGGHWYGHRVDDVELDYLTVYWFEYVGHRVYPSSDWYERGDAYCRLLIFVAVDGDFGLPPWRP